MEEWGQHLIVLKVIPTINHYGYDPWQGSLNFFSKFLWTWKTLNHLVATFTSIARQSQPYFEKRPTSVVASRHQPFIWECRIRGVPEPVIQWYHNGRNVTFDQNRMKLASGSLHFVSVLEQYNGSYVCEGSNTLGKISSQPVAFVVACK